MHKPRSRLPDYLPNLAIFRTLGADQLARISGYALEIEAPQGTTIFSRGDPCDGLHIVVFGLVKLSLGTEHGDERVLDLVGSGHSLSPGPLFRDATRRLTAETLHDTKLVFIPKASLMSELEQSPDFARCIIIELSQRVEQLVHDLENCTLRSGRERVIWLLLSLLPASHGRASASITLPAKKGILASRMNLTHEHFSRILHDLAETDLIAMTGRQIEIPDIARLQAAGGAFGSLERPRKSGTGRAKSGRTGRTGDSGAVRPSGPHARLVPD